MSANVTPIFIKTPNTGTTLINAASTARDGSTGTLFTAFTAGSDGSRLDYITFTSSQTAALIGASVLKVCRVYIDTSGTLTLLQEILLPLLTPSNTVIGPTATITFGGGLLLSSGQVIKVSQSLCATAQDNTAVVARGGNY